MLSDDKPPGRLTRRLFISGSAATGVIVGLGPLARARARPTVAAKDWESLARAFQSPPDGSKAWVYWWWLDGAASAAGITADLETMKAQGIGGGLLFDAGLGGADAPQGPLFMSEEWRVNFRHAVREAARLGLEMSVNLCSGWNAGGPW